MSKNFIVGKYELDDYQMKLLNYDGNSLVIAGAGSGKTLTILGKINYLIENNICNPENILVISFTNASVQDISARINYDVFVCTFHKLAMHILDEFKFNYTICSSDTLNYIVNETIRKCDENEQKTILNFLNIYISYEDFLESKYFYSLCNLIVTFINLFKTNNLSRDDIFNKNFNKIEKEMLIIIFKIYYKYIIEKQSMHQLDFDDLIIYATNIVKNIDLDYKYIIIDEFQDTSLIRLNLIKEIYKKTNAKIIVVGDDYQSIYHFSGCDLNIFLNFNNFFSNVLNIKLVNTYRNSLSLIKIASKFIEKNPLQIKKNLISQKRCDNPIIFVPYINKKNILKKILDKLMSITDDIMILTRNNRDIYEYIDDNFIIEDNIIFYKEKEIKFYTVHKSKGLEASFVVILNCNDTYLGFPNKIENNPIIDKIIVNNEMKYAEERRLFYVAITRCKEKTYLVYDKNKPSTFIKEIKKITKKELNKIEYFK